MRVEREEKREIKDRMKREIKYKEKLYMKQNIEKER
jgi:hypothetical protein